MDEFLSLIEKHRHEFFRYILRMVWDSSVAEDVFASAVLASYENRHKFVPGTNFRAWMYRIITNKCYVANREIKRAFAPLDEGIADDASLSGDWHALQLDAGYVDVLKDPTRFLEQCGDEVTRAFKRLSTAERSCLLLRAAERFSYQEIAETLEMPVGTVMTHLSRGRAKLRRELLVYAQQSGVVRQYPRLLEMNAEMKDQARRSKMNE
jgi:RNA polymerase sigma-70 factor (ECF subfamily)